MPAFEYVAFDVLGRKKHGILEGESAKQIRQKLRQQSLMPMSVASVKHKKSLRSFSFMKTKIPRIRVSDLALLLRHLATLIGSAMPLEEALLAVAEQFERSSLKSILLSVRSTVLEGHSLADGMRQYASVFPPLYCATVASGEQSGHLNEVLLYLADYAEQQQKLKQKIQHALIYPSLMLCVSFCMVAFLLTFVVPKMVSVFSDSEQTLPWITRALINVSHFSVSNSLYLALIFFLFYGMGYTLMKKEHYQRKRDAFFLKVPVIGYSIRLINSARFMRTLGILFSAGVPILEAMRISKELVRNHSINESIKTAISRVREGTHIHQALKETRYFSPMSIHLIASGEASGHLETMLSRAAIEEENAVTRLIDTALSLFEPMLILLMGIIVLFIVLAILLPIFSLYQFIN